MRNFYKSFKTIILLLTLLTFGVSSAWGLDQYVTVTDFNSSTTYSGSNLNHVSGGTFSKTDNHVTFSINGLDGYQDNRLMYAGIGSYPGSKSSTLSWSVENANYTLLVTGVGVSVRGYQATTSTKNVSATISGGGQTSTTANCQTNNTSGANGAKSASISNASGISSATLTVNTTSSKPKLFGVTVDTYFGITSVTYTYKVTHKEYLFGFAAVANKNISAAGNVSASVKSETVQAGVGETSASTTATFTATVNDGYRFEGWYNNSSYTGSAVSTATTYKPTINNNTAGSVQTLTLYAKFVPVTVNSVASAGTLNFTAPGNNTTTAVFNVSNADATADFTKSISGDAGWEVTGWSYNSQNKQVTVNAKFTCSATTTQGAHTANITLTSKATDGTSQIATVTANVDLSPTLTANKNTIDFGTYTLAKDTKKNNVVTLTFNANAINFEKTADATIAPFTAVLSANHQTLTVYFEPTEVGSWEKDLVVTVKNNQNPQLSAQQTIHITGAAQRNTATITNNIANSYMVDDAALNLNTLWTSTSDGDKEYSIVSFTSSGSNNEGATAPSIVNKQLSLGQAGTLVIKMQQPQTTNYNAVEVTKTITINKNTNALTCDWNSWSKNLATDDGTSVHFSSNNDATPITVIQASGEDNATYYPEQHAIYTAFNLGSATWTVAQAENYKYVAPTPQTLTVNIVTVTEGCYVYGPAYPDATASSVGEIIIPKAGAGDVLSFQMKRNQLAGDQATVTVFDANNTQLAQWKPSAKSTLYYDDASNHTYTLPTGATKVYFQRGGTLMDSDNPYINNIRITRKEWITLQDINGNSITSLDRLTNTIGGNSATAIFYVDNSVCASEIKVASNDSNITVSPDSFTPSAERQQITVTYSSNTPEEIDATITVYTASKNATLTLTAETEKQTPYLTWGTLYQAEPVSLPVTFTDNAAATASNDAVVTYSVQEGEESIISVADDGLSFTVVGEGTAHLTATSAENTMWKSVSETKTINTTNKKIQNIVWNQNFTRSLAPNDERELTAEVHIFDLAAGTDEYSADRTALIQYTCPNNNGVIEMIDATHFRVLNYGETTITASVTGNDDFAAASSVTKIVRVREAQTGECDPALMYESTNEIEFYAFSLGFPEVSHVVTLDRNRGLPDKLNFYVRGVSYDVAAVQYYVGGIDVYESTDGGSTWSAKLGYVNPEKNTTAYSETIQLSQNATHLRFVRAQGGQGYHYVGGVTVTAVPELRVANAEFDLGNIGCGATYNGNIELSYFNVKGNLAVTKSNSTNGLTIEDEIEAECGTSHTINVPFSVYPTVEGAWANVVTITDALQHKSVNVTLTANVTKAPQSIVWNPETNITSTTPPELNAYATSDLPVTYDITSGSDVATITDGKVVISNTGEFTIKVSQAGNVSFQSTELTRTFTVEGGYVFNGAVSSDWNTAGNWEIGEVPTADKDVIVHGNVIINSSNVAVNSLTIDNGSIVTLTEGSKLTIGEGHSFKRDQYGSLVVNSGAEVDINGTLKVANLTVESSIGTSDGSSMSGQIAQAEHIAYTNAYVEINMDPSGVVKYESQWYGFTVPFEVDIHDGISRKEGDEYRDCIYGTDCSIVEYDAAKRLATGKGWKSVSASRLSPGHFYLMTVNASYNTYRFKAAEGSFSEVTEKSLIVNGTGSDANWNGVGNSTLQHVKASYDGGSYVQVFQNGLNAYKTVPTSSTTFVVGCPFFIQATETSTLTLTPSLPLTKGMAYYAPRREQEEQADAICVNFSAGDGSYSDPIYVSATDKEEDTYILGHDLSKAGESTIVPQMWVKAYGKKLSVHESALQGNNANCALGLYAPKEGNYKLAVEKAPEDADLFLTYKGNVIWNLSSGPYAFKLAKGTTEDYGLRIEARVEQVAPGNNGSALGEEAARKVLINNMLYIVSPEGKMYDATGKSVK